MAKNGDTGANLGFEAKLRGMADKMRGFPNRLVQGRELRLAA